jgi:DUF3102 family protein
MTDTLTTKPTGPVAVERSLDELAKLIKAEHTAVTSASENINRAKEDADKVKHAAVRQANVVSRAIKAGELLKEAKAKMPHGEWLLWLKKQCELSQRTAQRYMKLADDRPKIERVQREKNATVADLTLNQALKLFKPPPNPSDLYDNAEATLIKKLQDLSAEDAEAAIKGTIKKLKDAVAALPPTEVAA